MTKRKRLKQAAIAAVSVAVAAALAAIFRPGDRPPEPAREPVTLTLWSIWSSDSESNKIPFLKTLAEFSEQYPYIHVELEQAEATPYVAKIRTAIAANEAPDVFYYGAGGVLKCFVDAGKVMPLDPYLTDNIRGRLLDGMLDNLTFDGKVYGLPYTFACSVLFCNTELFKKYGVKIPETWNDLMKAVSIFRAAGLTPMAVGGKDRWPTNMYTDILALRAAGYDEFHAAMTKKEGGSFVTPGMRLGARKFEELRKAGAFAKDAASLTRDESEVPFYQGKIPMYYSGNWTAGNCDLPSAAVRGKIIPVRFPVIEGGKGSSNDFMGGVAEEFCVSARTAHPEEAFLLWRYLAENHSRNAWLASAGIPTWKVSVDESKINPIMKAIVQLTSNARHFHLWGNTSLGTGDSELLKDTGQELLAGTITADQFCEKMQTVYSGGK